MSNLAISISQQLPPSPSTLPAGSPLLTPSNAARAESLRATHIASARAWATKAREIAEHITPPVRTAECDAGCAVATYHLGEFAEMDGQLEEARRWYGEAVSLGRGLKAEESSDAIRDAVVKRAQEGLERVKKQN